MRAVWLARFKSCSSASPRGYYHLSKNEHGHPSRLLKKNGTWALTSFVIPKKLGGARGEHVLIGENTKKDMKAQNF